MFKCAFCTLGCKVNQCESEALRAELEEAGFQTVPFSEKADVYIINTCSVTMEAERKSRQMVRRCKKLNENARVFVTGCAAQRAPKEFFDLDGVTLVAGNREKYELKRMILENATGIFAGDISQKCVFQGSEASVSEKTRAFIKVQDGCNNFCSYCIIPYLRGRECSRDLDSILRECEALTEKGYREIVLTGIHLSSYGKETGMDLGDLVTEIAKIKNVGRLRLGSLEPNVITREFMDKVSSVKGFCPHFHLSLQSGSDAVLKRMNRHYTASEYLRAVELLREYYPLASVTTDIIAGFAGETDREHRETLEFIKKVGFSFVHVFPYSERAGTVGAKMPQQVLKETRDERARELIEEAKRESVRYRQQFVGKTVEVLTEDRDRGITREHVEVTFKEKTEANKIINVKIIGLSEEGFLGE